MSLHGKSACYMRRAVRSEISALVSAVIAKQIGCPVVPFDRFEQLDYETQWHAQLLKLIIDRYPPSRRTSLYLGKNGGSLSRHDK